MPYSSVLEIVIDIVPDGLVADLTQLLWLEVDVTFHLQTAEVQFLFSA